jgi:hypothetical protein
MLEIRLKELGQLERMPRPPDNREGFPNERHPERSEGSPNQVDRCLIQEILHYVQDDVFALFNGII